MNWLEISEELPTEYTEVFTCNIGLNWYDIMYLDDRERWHSIRQDDVTLTHWCYFTAPNDSEQSQLAKAEKIEEQKWNAHLKAQQEYRMAYHLANGLRLNASIELK